MKRITILFLVVVSSIWLGPYPNTVANSLAEDAHHKSEKHHDDHDAHKEGTLELSQEQLDEFDIKILKAGPGTLIKYVETPGAVVVNEETLSHISARFPGIVKEVQKKIGDSVERGEVLAEIESNESLTTYTIKSLIAGTVIAKHATLGELLKGDDVAYTIANLNTVWINLSIYQADIPQIRTGQIVTISQGHGLREAQGVISYISPVVDEDTRTATARVVIANTEGTWMPGLFVTGRITVASKVVPLLIPTSAVQNIHDKPSVFVRTKNGLEPTEISLGESNDKQVAVTAGLHEGQEYVSKHSFTLKAELSKSSFGHGHNH